MTCQKHEILGQRPSHRYNLPTKQCPSVWNCSPQGFIQRKHFWDGSKRFLPSHWLPKSILVPLMTFLPEMSPAARKGENRLFFVCKYFTFLRKSSKIYGYFQENWPYLIAEFDMHLLRLVSAEFLAIKMKKWGKIKISFESCDSSGGIFKPSWRLRDGASSVWRGKSCITAQQWVKTGILGVLSHAQWPGNIWNHWGKAQTKSTWENLQRNLKRERRKQFCAECHQSEMPLEPSDKWVLLILIHKIWSRNRFSTDLSQKNIFKLKVHDQKKKKTSAFWRSFGSKIAKSPNQTKGENFEICFDLDLTKQI